MKIRIAGIKLTHDGSVAGIACDSDPFLSRAERRGRLVFCTEMEKVKNGARYSRINDVMQIEDVLVRERFSGVSRFVVDGWKHSTIDHMGDLMVMGYHEHEPRSSSSLEIGRDFVQDAPWPLNSFASYPHMTGHILSAYCTSPFAEGLEPAYVVTWDGGQNPRLHFVDPNEVLTRRIHFVASLFDVYGIIYGIMGRYFGPYKVEGIESASVERMLLSVRFGGYEVPGKIMSYIGLGKTDKALVGAMMAMYFNLANQITRGNLAYKQDGILEHEFMRAVKRCVEQRFPHLSDADVLASVHDWLEVMLVDNVRCNVPEGSNLCFVGGSALNIKWNTALRESGHYRDVYIPPFPNDSGSGIGAACAYMALQHDCWKLDWSVYAGPKMPDPDGVVLAPGWSRHNADAADLARILAERPDEVVVVLNGRAEVGPRALGNRSVLANPCNARMKDILNAHKRRETFRPVAPICLEQYAPEVFTPGSPDPFMLFDHEVKPSWRERVPAIVHVDNTARLQTVNEHQNPFIHDLLREFFNITGVPLLCNTSANFNGSGFFPDVESAMEWGKARFIYSEGSLFVKESDDEG